MYKIRTICKNSSLSATYLPCTYTNDGNDLIIHLHTDFDPKIINQSFILNKKNILEVQITPYEFVTEDKFVIQIVENVKDQNICYWLKQDKRGDTDDFNLAGHFTKNQVKNITSSRYKIYQLSNLIASNIIRKKISSDDIKKIQNAIF